MSAFSTKRLACRAQAFEIGMWAYLSVVAGGLAYVMWRGVSFFPAVRQAQFQFTEVLQTRDVSKFPPFVNGVVETWPARIGAFPPDLAATCSILLVFIVGTLMFSLARKRPSGEPLLDGPNRGLAMERARQALELSGRECQLYRRTDHGHEATSVGNKVYLPREFVLKLDRPHLTNVPEHLAFLIVHETTHSTTWDNLLWSFGRSLIFIVTAVAGTLLATPIFLGAVIAIPNDLVRLLPDAASVVLGALFGAIILAFIGATVHGLFANLGAAREFFADAVAAAVVGREALPYAAAGKPHKRGTIATAWSTEIAEPDRRLHALGTTPRGGALAASVVSTWCVMRTLILMVDPWWSSGPLWAFDLACIGAGVFLLGQLPPRMRGVRDYGSLPIGAAFLLALALPAAFAMIGWFAEAQGMTLEMRGIWLLALTAPPLLALVTLLVWRRAAVVSADGVGDVDRLPPRFEGGGRFLLLVAAVPAYIFGHALGGLSLYTVAVTGGDWMTGSFGHDVTLMVNAASVPVCFAILVLIAKNFTVPSRASVIVEILCVNLAIAAGIYVNLILMLTAAAQPPAQSGPPANPELFMQMLASFPRDAVIFTLVAATATAAMNTASWRLRYQLIPSPNKA